MPTDPHPLAGRAESALRRYVAAATRTDHETGAASGLTLSSCAANALNTLVLHGALTPGELGRTAGLGASGTVTGVVDQLERAGYVHRERCPRDRRRVVVEPDGDRLAALGAPRADRLAAVLDSYDEARLAVVAEFLEALAAAETAALPAPTTSATPQ